MNSKNDSDKLLLLEEFSIVCKNSEFNEFLTESNFNPVYNYCDQDGYMTRYYVGYESNICRLCFISGLGGGVSIGLAHKSDKTWETVSWIDLEYVIYYLLNEPIKRDLDIFVFNNTNKNRIKNRLSEIYYRFIPLSEQIISMFKDEKTMSQWRPLLQEYINEDTRRRYNLK